MLAQAKANRKTSRQDAAFIAGNTMIRSEDFLGKEAKRVVFLQISFSTSPLNHDNSNRPRADRLPISDQHDESLVTDIVNSDQANRRP